MRTSHSRTLRVILTERRATDAGVVSANRGRANLRSSRDCENRTFDDCARLVSRQDTLVSLCQEAGLGYYSGASAVFVMGRMLLANRHYLLWEP